MTSGGASPPVLHLLPWRVADGATNMATDEAMGASAFAEGHALLRFYGWEPWCLSLGRHQPASATLLGKARAELRPGLDVVRRPSGGRSVFHGPEITYAFACPNRAWGGPRSIYERVHGGLRAGLGSLGVPIDRSPGSRPSDPEPGALPRGDRADLAPGPAACFRDPAPGEITAGGRKLVGSAQWRHGGALLQHGSLLLSNAQRLGRLDAAGEASEAEAASSRTDVGVGLDELLDPMPSREAIVRALVEGLAGAFGPARPADALSAPRELVAKYRSEEWQWRVSTPGYRVGA